MVGFGHAAITTTTSYLTAVHPGPSG